MRQGCVIKSLVELENEGVIQLGRGVVISKKDLKSKPGNYPVYSSAQLNNGVFGHFGNYMFDEELITWSVDGGGALFHRNKHKFSITNVGGFCRVLKSDILNVRYLFFVLSYLHSTIQFDWVKKAHPSVLRKEYKTIPIPPHSEQLRIVSILDECFEAIDQAKANTERNLKNARELFESCLNSNVHKLLNSYPSIRLDSVLERITYGFTNPMPTSDAGPWMLTAKNVQNGFIDFSNGRRTTQEAYSELLTDKSRGRVGDVLLTKDGTLGRVAVLDRENCCLNQSVAILRPSESILPDFLMFILMCKYFQDLMLSQAGGSTIKHLYITRVDKLLIPELSIFDQKKFIENSRVLLSAVSDLEKTNGKKLNELNLLQKSLLSKAFKGELTC
jgi:type I restriction enzyme S subunit